MSDETSNLPQAKPRKTTAKSGYLIQVCPHCGRKFQVVPRNIVQVETDELGRLKRDGNGRLIPKTRISYAYQTITELNPNFTDQDSEVWDPLRERSAKEKAEIIALTEELEKPKERKKLVAELAA